MMQKKRLLILLPALVFLVFSASPTAYAAEEYTYLEIDSLEEGVPDSAGDYLKDVDISAGIDADGTLKKIADDVAGSIGDIVRSSASNAMLVLAAAMLCAAVGSICPKGTGGTDYITLAGVLAVAAASVSGVHSLVGAASDTMEELGAFSKLLLPVLASASAVTGSAASAAAKYAAAALFLDVLMTVGQKLVLPMIYMYLAVSVGSAAFGGRLSGVQKLISRAIKLILTVLSISFTAYLMITGLVASSADAAAVKLTKTVISTLLPVVGSMVADAADTVASGVQVLKSAVGVFGMLVVISVCAVPFLRLAVNSIMFRAAAALSETVSDSTLSGLMDSVSTAYGMALGLVGTEAVMLLVSVISVLKAVTGT
ncbi:MAG: hypothetical protein ACI3VB_04140 [Oscillospiraceae bacterium]